DADRAGEELRQRRHGAAGQAARDDGVEPPKVGGAVQGEAVQRDPAALDADADRAHLPALGPHAGPSRVAGGVNADVRARPDDDVLQATEVPDDVAIGPEGDDRIPDELP